MNANNNTTTAAAIDNLAAKVAANATAAIEQTTTPSKTGVVRWAKRAALWLRWSAWLRCTPLRFDGLLESEVRLR